MSAAKNEHHAKIAKARGPNWHKNMLAGRRAAQINPSMIRLIRISKNIEQSKIAVKMKDKMSPSTFGSIERARRPVTEAEAKEIASLLGVKVPKIFVKKGDKFVALLKDSGI